MSAGGVGGRVGGLLGVYVYLVHVSVCVCGWVGGWVGGSVCRNTCRHRFQVVCIFCRERPKAVKRCSLRSREEVKRVDSGNAA